MLHLEGTPAPMVACPYECLRLRSFIKEAEMPTDFEELKRQLLQSNDEFRQLATLHHDLDERIHNLAARQYLSEPEQLEEVTLKKKKLQLKDQMERMLRQHRGGRVRARASAASPPPTSRFRSDRVAGPAKPVRPLFLIAPAPLMKIDKAGCAVHRRRARAGRAAGRQRGATGGPPGFAALGAFFDLLLPRSRAAGSAGRRAGRRRRPTAAS